MHLVYIDELSVFYLWEFLGVFVTIELGKYDLWSEKNKEI